MGIVSGLAGLKAAAELTKTLREAAKAGSLKPDEFAGRVGEIYDYIVDSKDALVEAKDEIQDLKNRLQAVNSHSEIDNELKHDGFVFWRNHADGKHSGPYCLYCWRKENTLIPLTHISGTFGGSHPSKRYDCQTHGVFLVPTGKRLLNVHDQFPLIGALLLGVDCLQ